MKHDPQGTASQVQGSIFPQDSFRKINRLKKQVKISANLVHWWGYCMIFGLAALCRLGLPAIIIILTCTSNAGPACRRHRLVTLGRRGLRGGHHEEKSPIRIAFGMFL